MSASFLGARGRGCGSGWPIRNGPGGACGVHLGPRGPPPHQVATRSQQQLYFECGAAPSTLHRPRARSPLSPPALTLPDLRLAVVAVQHYADRTSILALQPERLCVVTPLLTRRIMCMCNTQSRCRVKNTRRAARSPALARSSPHSTIVIDVSHHGRSCSSSPSPCGCVYSGEGCAPKTTSSDLRRGWRRCLAASRRLPSRRMTSPPPRAATSSRRPLGRTSPPRARAALASLTTSLWREARPRPFRAPSTAWAPPRETARCTRRPPARHQ